MNKPLVSICLPVYNKTDELIRSLECLLGQTYKNTEVIISDDCSPNKGVREILKKYAEQDSRIRLYLQEKNLGVFENLRFVYQQAKGDYFMWASDDDIWDLSYIEKCVEKLEADSKAIVSFSLFNNVSVEGEVIRENKEILELSISSKYKRLKKFITQNEEFGKGMLMYGVIRNDDKMRQTLNELWLSKLWGFDIVLVFIMLSFGNVVYVNEPLFKKIFMKDSPGVVYSPHLYKKYLKYYYSVIFKLRNLGLISKLSLLICVYRNIYIGFAYKLKLRRKLINIYSVPYYFIVNKLISLKAIMK